jgi:hypothetical protein
MSWPCWMVQCGWSILDGSRTVRVFTQLIDFKRSSLLERPSQTHPEMFYQLSGHSLAQSSWHIKFTIHCKVLVTAAKFLFPYQLTHSQVPVTGTWTSLETIIWLATVPWAV